MTNTAQKISISVLRQMKRDGRKIAGVVAWDYPMAQIAERAGVDIVSIGDSVGKNLWGQATETEVTLDELLVVCKAVRRGVTRALVSCDLPDGPVQAGTEAALNAAVRLFSEGGADVVKVHADPGLVRAITNRGIPVFAEFHGEDIAAAALVEKAKQLENAGAVLLNFRHSGPVAGAQVVRAVSVPVIGGLGGGPWLDGRMRLVQTAIGYSASAIDSDAERYANVARMALDALTRYAADVRTGRPLKGEHPG